MFIVDCKIMQKTKVPQDNASSFPHRPLPHSTGLGARATADMAAQKKSMDKHRGNNRIPFAPLNNRLRQIHPCLITNWETTAKTGIRLMG